MYQILIDNRRSIGGALRSYYSVWRDGRLVQLATRGSATPEQAFHAVVYKTKRECVAAIEAYIGVLVDKAAGRA